MRDSVWKTRRTAPERKTRLASLQTAALAPECHHHCKFGVYFAWWCSPVPLAGASGNRFRYGLHNSSSIRALPPANRLLRCEDRWLILGSACPWADAAATEKLLLTMHRKWQWDVFVCVCVWEAQGGQNNAAQHILVSACIWSYWWKQQGSASLL